MAKGKTVKLVSARGSDAHDGAAENRPMATVEAGLARLREKRSNAMASATATGRGGTTKTIGAELVLREGTHFLSPDSPRPLLLGFLCTHVHYFLNFQC
eukprot:SAG11_NODE_4816_length_1756_cov_2.062764_3_plen_99_part_00